MKNRPMAKNHSIVSEWEDNIIFDADDPDFCNAPANINNNVLSTNSTTIVVAQAGNTAFNFKVPNQVNNMSMAGVHGPQFTDICSPLGRPNMSMSSSLSDLVGSPLEIPMDNVLTIEELRQQMGSCFTCGVSWTDDHVSLDCSECGGYSLDRPCPLCDGVCGVQWKRDFTMSHACGKARWLGVCPSYPETAATMHLTTSAPVSNSAVTTNSASCASAAAAATQLRLAQELCARLEQLSASAHM